MPTRNGQVFLVGAGPGDPGLLTVRAAEVVRSAGVLLYDALVAPSIVDLAPPSCERIFVGKRAAQHAMPQEAIETIMVRKAKEGRRVVRLKGGDPFVFGRGGEEAQALRDAGIPFEVVPGISSALAAPAYAGIPLTHRELSASFLVLTGHEDPQKGSSTIDWSRACDPNGTLVILMGIGNLAEIVARLLAGGLPRGRPAAVIENGTLPQQRTVAGTLGTIVSLADRERIAAPAVIVVGGVVALRDRLKWFERSPLFGKRVLITRPAFQNAEMQGALLHLGAEPVAAPAIAIAPPDDESAATRATLEAGSYAWVVFTSANGVRDFFRRLDERRDDARVFGRAKIAAIGPATAAALRARGIFADATPPRAIAEDLAALLVAATAPGDRVLIYRATEARDVLPETLRAAQRDAVVVAAYKTIVVRDPKFAEKVARCDVLTFTSASTVDGFVQNLGGFDAARDAAAGKTIACIGPVTAGAARAAGLHVSVVASTYTADGLVAALNGSVAASA